MVTTVKITEETKSELDSLRRGSESYDQIISRLLREVRPKNIRQRMIEGYKRIGKEERKEFEEWDRISSEWPEW